MGDRTSCYVHAWLLQTSAPSSGGTSIRDIVGGLEVLEIRTHWLEKQVKEAEDKAYQVKALGDSAWVHLAMNIPPTSTRPEEGEWRISTKHIMTVNDTRRPQEEWNPKMRI
jgi:hypothetical protein